jgi:glycosyltransferase involved in cell wall biosynthesis
MVAESGNLIPARTTSQPDLACRSPRHYVFSLKSQKRADTMIGRSTLPILKLSVVMATYNRAGTIARTLAHLADQTLDPASYEVIVVDDGSADNTREVVAEWRAKAPFRMRYLYHPNRGPGYTQNRGLEAAQAPIVLLMADDIFMTRDALAAHLRVHETYPEPEVAVLGRVLQSPELTGSVFLRKWDAFRFSAFSGQKTVPYYRFWACNISAKHDFVMRHGPFREHRGRAGAAAHEDPQLGYQLHLAGLRILYSPDALGYHFHVVSLEGACRRRYMQGLNFDEFRQFAPAPEIPVAYHVLNRSTIADHVRALFGPRRIYLDSADRNVFQLFLKYSIWAILFNELTLGAVWEPLLNRAERNRFLAALASSWMYRGLLFVYFRRGVRDAAQRFGPIPSGSGHAQRAGD